MWRMGKLSRLKTDETYYEDLLYILLYLRIAA